MLFRSDLYDDSWRIYTKNDDLPPQFIGSDAKIDNCMVNEGCEIHGELKHSILFTEIFVGQGAVVEDSILFPRVKVGAGARVYRAIVTEDYVIEPGEVIGDPTSDEILLIGNPEDTPMFEE